jgi:hypothetical protein
MFRLLNLWALHRSTTPVQDAKDTVVAALLAIEEKMRAGISFDEFAYDVGELNVSLLMLEKIAPDLRKSLQAIRTRYEQADELWTVCLTEEKVVYEGELIPLARKNIASLLAKDLLKEFPQLDRDFEDGGARSANQSHASFRRLLHAIWADAMAQGQRLRAELSKPRDTSFTNAALAKEIGMGTSRQAC